ncbi:tetratricopeptide repeat protein [Rosistilla oblonga]|uniref:tetratricopeptide repeat protein n=1 Tax=Rosistilla oblonga TaxID=2527990 RepID=UPI003A96C232
MRTRKKGKRVEAELSAVPPTASRRRWLVATVATVFVLFAGWGVMQYRRAAELSDLRRACRLAEQAGSWQELQRAAERWVALQPFNDQAIMHLATAKKSLEDWVGFVDAVEQLPVSNAYLVPSLAVAGDVAIDHLEDIERAERLFWAILAIDPRNEQAYQRLIFLYSMTLQKAKLQAVIRQAIERGAQPVEAGVYLTTMSALNFSDGLFRVAGWRAATPGHEPLEVAYAIYLARASGNESNRVLRMLDSQVPEYGTLDIARRMQERYPNNIELLSFWIDHAMERGEVEQVREALSRWQPELQGDYRYWRYLGWLQDMSGDLETSLSSYRKSLSIHPLDWRARNEMATLQRALGVDGAAANAELAAEGKELERMLKELPSASQLSTVNAAKLGEYARKCGDSVAERAFRRGAGGA